MRNPEKLQRIGLGRAKITQSGGQAHSIYVLLSPQAFQVQLLWQQQS